MMVREDLKIYSPRKNHISEGNTLVKFDISGGINFHMSWPNVHAINCLLYQMTGDYYVEYLGFNCFSTLVKQKCSECLPVSFCKFSDIKRI